MLMPLVLVLLSVQLESVEPDPAVQENAVATTWPIVYVPPVAGEEIVAVGGSSRHGVGDRRGGGLAISVLGRDDVAQSGPHRRSLQVTGSY